MSRIMQQLYAEARAARDATARVSAGETLIAHSTSFPTEPTLASNVEWRQHDQENTGRTLASQVIETAMRAIRHPVPPEQHAEWWRERMSAM
jgi:hypothetical protein